MVAVRPDGTTQGRHPPSSELPFHREMHARRPDVRSVVHAHPTSLVAFSICGRTPDTRVFAKARRVCGEVAFALCRLPDSAELGRVIADAFAGGADCVMLENHGVAVAGESLAGKFKRFEKLKCTAKTLLRAQVLGQAEALSDAGRLAARGDFE